MSKGTALRASPRTSHTLFTMAALGIPAAAIAWANVGEPGSGKTAEVKICGSEGSVIGALA